jgi:hypothetical protein
MKRSRGRPSQLTESVRQPLNTYALAAGAAGVGMLALAQPTEAKIVYTPAHIKIGANSGHFLDLNHDGTHDFKFVDAFSWLSTFDYGGTLGIQPLQKSNQILGYNSARALVAGAKIGPGGQFRPGSLFLAQEWVTFCTGKWCNVRDRYLGLKFVVKGEPHFGWARLTVTFGSKGVVGLLTGYAYETIPNKPIIAGKTEGPEEGSVDEANPATLNEPTVQPSASLGLLATGSPGLSIWRREESAAERN